MLTVHSKSKKLMLPIINNKKVTGTQVCEMHGMTGKTHGGVYTMHQSAASTSSFSWMGFLDCVLGSSKSDRPLLVQERLILFST